MRLSDLVFFLSGAAALAYEVLWGRLLARLLGGDAEGAALVLALFMAGLGLGAWGFAGWAASTPRPRRSFALLEVWAAAWACGSPWLLAQIDPLAALPVRALLAALVILPPTVAMGATFPMMGRLVIGPRTSAGGATGAFYGANTLGACAGALLAPALLMPAFGLSLGLVAAAALDLAAAALVFALPERGEARGALPRPAGGLGWRLAGPPFLLGLSSLALEVLFVRLLVSVTGATVYAFAIVLAVFLLGIGLGSRQAGESLGRGRSAAAVLAGCAAAAPALALLGLLLLRWQLGESDLFGILTNRQPAGAGTWRLWASHATFAGLALLPATLVFGAALPAAVACAIERQPGRAPEATLGAVYLVNTVGALLGSLLGGFLLLPAVGPRSGVALALVPCLLAALLVPGVRRGVPWIGATVALALGVLALRPGRDPQGLQRLALIPGRNATVSVEQTVEADGAAVRSLRVNGKVEATTAPVDMRLQRLLAHVPGLLHGEVRSALVIGMGTGMTAGALLDLPALEALTVMEIERGVPRAARWFADWNGGLLDDPRVEVLIADGRLALERSSARYDLITADPLHPATRGSSDLFSIEHFRSMAAHLAPGGVASQWLPLYELSDLDVRTVVATWVAAFPHASAWLTAYDLALVGSLEPLPALSEPRPLQGALAAHLSQVGVHSFSELAALRVGDHADLQELAAGVAPMTLDLPVLELRAPFSYLSGYTTPILAWAAREEPVAALPPSSRPRALEVRRLLRDFLHALPDGWSAAAAAYGRALLALPPSRS